MLKLFSWCFRLSLAQRSRYFTQQAHEEEEARMAKQLSDAVPRQQKLEREANALEVQPLLLLFHLIVRDTSTRSS